MKNLSFVLWTVLFPVSMYLNSYLDFLARGSVVQIVSVQFEQIMGLVFLAAWFVIAYLLYEKK